VWLLGADSFKMLSAMKLIVEKAVGCRKFLRESVLRDITSTFERFEVRMLAVESERRVRRSREFKRVFIRSVN